MATQTKIFIADDHDVLEAEINDWLSKHPCTNVRFLQIVGDGGEANYAVLVAWEE